MERYCKITLAALKSAVEIRTGYSRSGLTAMFDTSRVNPVLPMSRADLLKGFVAAKSRMSISGAQPKRSAVLDSNTLMLTDTGGQYIIKPSPEEYPHLAEVEHACMAMTRALSTGRLTVAEHGLFPLADGELVYITRRHDRKPDGSKLHQLQMDSAMNIADKYDANTSYERIGQFIRSHVSVPLPALIAFYEQVLISYLLGNDDCHIRNLALLVDLSTDKAIGLTPAYDIVASSLYTEGGSSLALPLTIEDEEDNAGTTKGVDQYGFYTGGDFIDLGTGIGLSNALARSTMQKVLSKVENAKEFLGRSWVPDELKSKLSTLMDERLTMLGKY